MATYTSTYRDTRSEYADTPGAASPFAWISNGWNDVIGAPGTSLAIGTAFTLLCAAAYAAAAAMPMLTVSLLTALLIVSPFIAATAYFVARQREHELAPSLRAALRDVGSRALSIGMFSVLSALVVAAWLRLSSIAFALYYGTLGSSAAEVARAWTSGGEIPSMLVFITLAGIVLALTLFAIGAIALPSIVDRNQSVIPAMARGLRALRRNALTMVVWMLVLATFIALAFLSSLLLMPVVFPLLAYATWHSYRHLAS